MIMVLKCSLLVVYEVDVFSFFPFSTAFVLFCARQIIGTWIFSLMIGTTFHLLGQVFQGFRLVLRLPPTEYSTYKLADGFEEKSVEQVFRYRWIRIWVFWSIVMAHSRLPSDLIPWKFKCRNWLYQCFRQSPVILRYSRWLRKYKTRPPNCLLAVTVDNAKLALKKNFTGHVR